MMWYKVRKKEIEPIKEAIKRIVTPGLFVYMALFAVNVIINQGRILEDYDEFNHWGLIVKNMFLYNTYGTNAESVVLFNEYPPFTAIFQYFFLSIQKIYQEDTLIIAQNVLYLSIIIPITRTITWRTNLKKLWMIIPIIVFLPMIFYENFFLEILVDGLLGIMFAYLIFAAFDKEEDLKFKMLKIFTGLIMLCLTKTTGIGLAVIGIGMIFIRNVIDRKKKLPNSKKESKVICISIILTILFTSLWYIKVSREQDKRWDFTKYFQVEETMQGQQEKITESFWYSILNKNEITEKNLTVSGICLLLIAIFFCTRKWVKNETYHYYGIAFIIAVALYYIGTWITYITIFDVSEAMSLASFARYTSLILLSYSVFLANVFVEEEVTNQIRTVFTVIAILFVLLPISNIEEKYIDVKAHMDMANMNRDIYTKLRYQKDKLEVDDQLLFLTRPQDQIEFLKSLNEYEIMPICIKEARITSFRTIEDFENLVKNYTHIYIYRMEKEKKELIKDIFENNYVGDDCLYRVTYENEQVKLEIEG